MQIELTPEELLHLDHAIQHVMSDHGIDVPQTLVCKISDAENATKHKWPWTALCSRKELDKPEE